MPGIPYKYSETFAQLQRATERLHALIESGEFYAYGYLKRRKLLRQVRRLYNKLAGPVSPAVVGGALAAAGILTLAGCFPAATNPNPAIVPSFAPYQASPFGLAQLNSYDWFHGPAVLATLDDDADLDMIHGFADHPEGLYDKIAVRTNTGSSASPSFPSFQSNPHGLVGTGYAYSGDPLEIVAAGDLDGDGDVDLIATYTYDDDGYTPYIYFIQNNGTPATPSFGTPQVIESDTPYRIQSAALVDVDGDSRLDVVYMTAYSYDVYGAQNTSSGADSISFGSPTAGTDVLPDFGVEVPGSANIHDFEITDLDNDGDLDVLVGVTYGEGSNPTILHFDNLGTVPPTFEQSDPDPFGLAAPDVDWDQSRFNYWAEMAITAADLDNDGDMDLMLGPSVEWVSGDPSYYRSTFYFLENTGIP